jgi:formylmethanofuran dehydrogenase subunit D
MFAGRYTESANLKVTLLSGRSLAQAKSREAGRFSEEYLRTVAVCEMNPEDLTSLEIANGQNVKVTTKTGSVVLRAAIASQPLPRGVVFLPYGPWANMLIPMETYGTGMPSFKGLEAEVTPATDQKILDVRSLIGYMVSG